MIALEFDLIKEKIICEKIHHFKNNRKQIFSQPFSLSQVNQTLSHSHNNKHGSNTTKRTKSRFINIKFHDRSIRSVSGLIGSRSNGNRTSRGRLTCRSCRSWISGGGFCIDGLIVVTVVISNDF